jgi:hypothetical protein
MNKIFADKKRIFLDNWNSAYGNKILHVLFLIHLSDIKNRKPVMYSRSNLDNIFNFKFETIDLSEAIISNYYFEERDPFYIQNFFLKLVGLNYRFPNKNLDSVIKKHYSDFNDKMNFLYAEKLPDYDIMIRGHFFDYDLMPSFEIFNKYISIKDDLLNFIKDKYKDIEDDNSVAVHYRGTDFSTHLNHLFPSGIQVDREYYGKAIQKVENLLGSDVIYHLFSDDMNVLKDIFLGKKVVIHDDEAHIDWVSIFLMKNVIQTNSSFCWTASLYNKNISIQPKDGYNYHQGTGSIPYGFHQKNSILIEGKK